MNSWSPDSRKFAYISYRLAEELSAPKKKMAVQLYSVRSLIGSPEQFAKNHKYVLSRLAQMGYTGAEAASYADGKFSGLAPEEFRKALNDAGLEFFSSHTSHTLSAAELASGLLKTSAGDITNLNTLLGLDKKGIKVLSIPSAELSRGRGGPRCMSCPVNRVDL